MLDNFLISELALNCSRGIRSEQCETCRCKTGLPSKNDPGVSDSCSDKDVKSLSVGAVLIVSSAIFGNF